MPIIGNSAEQQAFETRRPVGTSKRTNYIGGDDPSGPQAFLVHEVKRPNLIKPHFHHVRQFQVIVSKGARLGKKDVPAISFHFADPSTPYGPIYPGEEEPLAFFTLRPELSDGTFYMPGSKEKMDHKAGRNIVCQVPVETEAGLVTFIEPQEDGLAAYRLTIDRAQQASGVDPQGSGGQYYLVMSGSVAVDGNDLPKFSLIFVGANEEAPVLVAGPDGADLLVMQFPVKRV